MGIEQVQSGRPAAQTEIVGASPANMNSEGSNNLNEEVGEGDATETQEVQDPETGRGDP